MLKKLKDKGINTVDEIDSATKDSEAQKEEFKKQRSYHAIILAKNYVGLRNLYKLVSISHLNYFYKNPRILKSIYKKYSEGLILGSACEAGELYQAIELGKSDEEIENIARDYDYLEIQPIGNNEFLVRNGVVPDREYLKDINRKIVELGEKLGKLVVATCDVHFMDPQDEIYRRILEAGQGYKDADEQAPLYLRTTEEMLKEFEYLGEEKAYEVVVTNTNKVSDMCDRIDPISPEKCPPHIPGCEEDIKNIAYKKAHELYGDPLPEIVQTRLDKELNSIISNGYSVMYIIAQRLVWKSNEDGYFVGSRGSVGSSLVATMMGITEVNGLPPHYVCPKCKKSYFEDENGESLASIYPSGYDMPDRTCECGTKLKKEGQDMPFATFLGFKAEKVPDIDLNFSGDNQADAHNHVKVLFGEDHAYRAGTISTVADKTAIGYVRGYCEDKGIILNNTEIERIAIGCTGVKRTTGQHPGGIIVIPQYMDVFDFTPYQYPADEPDSTWYTTHFDFHAIHDNVLKLDILGHDDPTMLRYLGDTTGIDIKEEIPFDDHNIISLFTSPKALGVTEEQILCKTGTLGIPEFGTNFAINMLLEIKPTHFADLVKIAGLSHGTNVWQGNVRDLIVNNVASFDQVVGCRDDIMVSLINYGLDPSRAFKISEFVRKGKAKKEPDTWLEHVAYMREFSVPEWFIECCRKIEYMFPKAHACAYVMMAYRVAWFKVYYPLYYYSAFFSIRRSDFDVNAMLKGYDGIKRRLIEIKEKGFGASAKEQAVGDTLAVALEMLARGFTFKNIDITKSLAKTFYIDEENKCLYLPFMAVDGLGENVANKIVEERDKKPFYCVEDFQNRGKVNQTTVNALRELGVFKGMPESAQLSLF